MANRTLSAVDSSEEGPKFLEKTVNVRGTDYKFRELSSEEYDKLYKQAEIDGEIDTSLLLRLMVMKSLAEPAMTGDQIGKLPFRVSRRLTSAVSDLHFEDNLEEDDPKTA